MSEHNWVQENLDAFVAGALSAQERSRVERHLDGCPECAHAKSDIAEMDQLVEGLFTRVRPDVGLEDRVIQTLRKAPRPRPSWLRFVAAAAAVIVLGMIGGGVQFAMNGTLPVPGFERAGEANTPQLARQAQQLNPDASGNMVGATQAAGMISIITRQPDPLVDASESMRDDFKGLNYLPYNSFPAVATTGKQQELWNKTGAGVNDRIDKEKGADKDKDKYAKESPRHNVEMRVTESESKKAEEVHLRLAPIVRFFDDDKARGPNNGDVNGFYDMKELLDKGKESESTFKYKVKESGKDEKDLAKAMDKAPIVSGGGGGIPGPGAGFMPPPGVPPTLPPTGLFSTSKTPIASGPATATVTPTGPATYFPMVPPPVELPPAEAPKATKRDDSKFETGEKGKGDGNKPVDPKLEPKKVEQSKQPEDVGRKIIRTGEMEFETDSFDSCIVTITKLVKTKSGFVATVNSDKLPNGKTKGSIVVRMPPQNLDDFILELRAALGKNSELKNQRLGSQDVTKSYTDIESRLRAARAIEERLINIIKTGKGEIKDLVAAERELGVWRTKIEEMEGEIRYYANQVALSTLTIQIYEKEIQAPTSVVVTETVAMRLEVDDVGKSHKAAMKLVEDYKGRITRSELKQHSAGQFTSVLHADIPPAKKDDFIAGLAKLGIVSDRQQNQRQTMEGGSGNVGNLKPRDADVQFQVTMNNTANVRPRLSADLKIATIDVPGSYADLLALIMEVGGQVRDGKLNEQDKLNIHASLDFNVPTSDKAKIDKLLEKIGIVLERINIRAPVSELSTEKKFGYTILLRDFVSIPPRHARVETIAAVDVAAAYAKVQDAITKAKGQVNDAKLNEQDKLNVSARIEFTVPAEQKDTIEKLLESLGTLLTRDNVQAPANQLATTKKFGFSLTLRDFASIPPSKASILTAATSNVPDSYAKLLDLVTKSKGMLVDAKLNEQDKLNVTAQLEFSLPAEQKEAIEKVLAQLGSVLSRNNLQMPMNVLSTPKKFGYTIILRDFANIPPTHATVMTVAAADVPVNYAKLVDAVVKAKGQISVARLDEQDKLNISASLNFTVPMAEKLAFDKLLGDVGTLLSRKNEQAPQNALTTETKFGYAVALRDFTRIPPRETFHVQLAAVDVAAGFKELQEAVAGAKGLVSVGQITEESKTKIEATFAFEIPSAQRQQIEALLAKVGAILSRTSSQIPITELATDQKVGYKLTIRSTAAIPPREIVTMKIDVKDVDAKATEVKEIVNAGKGRILDSTVDRHENGQVSGLLKIEVPFASQDALLKQIRGVGTIVSQQARRNPQITENDLTTSHILVTLNGTTPVIPSDEGLGSYVRTSLYMSFRIFAVCLMLIILGVSAVLPWALVVWLMWKAYVRLSGRTEMAPIDGAPPAPGPAQA